MNIFLLWKRFRKSAQDYGLKRALAKASARLGLSVFSLQKKPSSIPFVSVVGCGQAAYATICFFLKKNYGSVFLDCFDIKPEKAQRLKQAYHFQNASESFEQVLENTSLKKLVIASNHASHTAYAVAALKRGIDVFCEKPLCVSFDQLQQLNYAVTHSEARFDAGFNRPYSPAVQELKKRLLASPEGAFHYHAVIIGHAIPPDHWYNHPEEGTRISGNLGHWIDLASHLLSTRRQMPEWYELHLISTSQKLPADEHFTFVITTSLGDLLTMVMTTLHEPFGGIREQISFQNTTFSAFINDFKSLLIITETSEYQQHFPQKDPGHEALLRAVFSEEKSARNWEELRLSTWLTLHAAQLAREGIRDKRRIYPAELALRP